jgi:hypothetical protein
MAIAGIPIVFFFCQYYFTAYHKDTLSSLPKIPLKKFAALPNFYLTSKLNNFLVVQAPFHRFEAVCDVPLVMEYLNYILSIFMILIVLYSVKVSITNKDRSLSGMIVLICFTLCGILPFSLSGLANPSERLVVLMIIAAIAHLSTTLSNARSLKILFPLFIGLCIASYSWDIYNASRFNSILFSGSIDASSIGLNYRDHFSGIDPFGRSMIYYPAIRDNKAVQIFPTGLFDMNVPPTKN